MITRKEFEADVRELVRMFDEQEEGWEHIWQRARSKQTLYATHDPALAEQAGRFFSKMREFVDEFRKLSRMAKDRTRPS